jgi:hypothetical protein
MAIERNNSFHLLLSNDELKLLRLLAEREGLTASDYLRATLRRLAGASPHSLGVLRAAELMGGTIPFAQTLGLEYAKALGAALSEKKTTTKKRKAPRG